MPRERKKRRSDEEQEGDIEAINISNGGLSKEKKRRNQEKVGNITRKGIEDFMTQDEKPKTLEKTGKKKRKGVHDRLRQ